MIFSLSDKITFGQYSTKKLPVALTIQEIIERDPEYLAWMLDANDWFELDDEAEAGVDEATMVWDDDDSEYADNFHPGWPGNFGDK